MRIPVCWKRIAGKVIASVLREDMVSSVDSVQVYTRYDAGYEAAVHAMHSIFKEENIVAVLLTDAGNASNMVNKKVLPS